jgi:hypothetical protein
MSYKLQIKQVDLSHVTFDDTKTHYLVIDTDGNVSWRTGGSGGGDTYTNTEPVPVTIGGVASGTTFNSATMTDMWNMLLYPYQAPAFVSFAVTGSNPLEVGEALPSILYFTWDSSPDTTVIPGSVFVTDETLGTILSGYDSDGSLIPYTYITPIVRTTYGTHSWSVNGVNTNSVAFSRTTAKSWYWRVYWGTSAISTVPDATLITTLLNTPLRASMPGSYQFVGGDYKYLAIPNSYGIPTSIIYNGLPFALADSVDGYTLGSGNITYCQVSIENANLQTETYNVFRSKNPLVGAVSMTVS